MGSNQSVPVQEPITWFTEPANWNKNNKNEIFQAQGSTPSDVTLDQLIQKSDQFPVKFPIDTIRCRQLQNCNISQEVLERNINSTYPVIHEYGLLLCCLFLTHQKQYGNRNFYKNMTVLDLIERFLSKRAVTFVGVRDYYQLLDGKTGYGGWEKIGTSEEVPPLTLDSCLSYDEMKLSALLSISSHTVFINDGKRRNRGVFEEDRSKIEEDGVIIGLIGTRLPKANVMEHREILIAKSQNTHEFGYGRTFVPTLQGTILNFYGSPSLTFKELQKHMEQKPDRYVKLNNDSYFDRFAFARRLSLSIDTLLIEANDRALKLNKKAYIHIVGLGLGVWRVYIQQDQFFMDTFLDRVKLLLPTLTNVSDLHFAYINHKMAGEYKDGDQIGGITFHMSDKAGPHVRLTDQGKLLVVSYAWDSNSLPGNEFWGGSLDTSSDPAAACSTQVAELHNWHINPKVTAANLRIATLQHGLLTFEEYKQLIK